MTRRSRVVAAAVSAALVIAGSNVGISVAAEETHSPASATNLGTYGDYSRMFERSAGRFGSSGQWAWEPQTGLVGHVSHIRWGNPNSWPPDSYERFERSLDGQWVLLDGFGNSEGLLKQTVTLEMIGDVNCQNMVPLLPLTLGKQHYVKWNIPAEGYCLEAWGVIVAKVPKITIPPDLEGILGALVPGVPVSFHHKQVWFPPGNCSNATFSGRQCIKQYEVWKDDNPANGGTTGGPLELRIERDQILARGLGPAFIIHNYFPNNGWRAELNASWTY